MPPTDLSGWMQGLFFFAGLVAAILGILVYVKRLMEPKGRGEQRATVSDIDTLATKTELQHVETVYKTDIIRLESTLKDEIKRLEASLEKLGEATRKRTHELGNQFQPIAMKVARIELLVGMLAIKAGLEAPKLVDDGPTILTE